MNGVARSLEERRHSGRGRSLRRAPATSGPVTNDDYRSNSLRPRPSFGRRSSLAALNPRRLEDAHEPGRSRLPGCHVQLEHLDVDVLGGRAERCRLPWLALGEVVGYDVR
jgi:hypothetical protein